jgi:Zn-dependent protease
MLDNKPELPEKENKNNMQTTILSMVLFVVLFYFFITPDLLLIALIVLVLFVHEMGHYLMMKRYKYEQVSMVFIPFLGAMVQGKKSERYSQKERANIILAGPVPGIVFGVALFFLGLYLNEVYVVYAGTLFAVINALNLIPLDPLDGGQLLYLLFFDKKDVLRLYFLLGSSLFIIGLGVYFQNHIVIAFGFLLGFRVRAYQKILGIHRSLIDQGIDYVRSYESLTGREYHAIKRVILEHSTLANKMVDTDFVETQEFDEVMASEVNSVLEVPVDPDLSTSSKVLYLLIWAVSLLSVAYVTYYFTPKLLELVELLQMEQDV